MFDKIGYKIQGLAKIIFGISLFIGGALLLYSIFQFAEYKNILGTQVFSSLYGNTLSFIGIIYSVVLIVSGIITSYLIYGFGVIINCQIDIKEKTSDTYTKVTRISNDMQQDIKK